MVRRSALATVVAFLLILSQVLAAAAATGRSLPGATGAGGAPAAPIEKDLQRKILAGDVTSIVAEFSASADLKPAKAIKDRTKRGAAVLTALTATAARSQAQAKAMVKGTKGASATTYWLTNVLVVESSDPKTLEKLARQLAKTTGVTSVRAPKVYPLIEPVATKAVIQAATGDPEWGVEKIGADQAWAEGVLGQGIVVANVDTGVDYLHPALVDHYRGNDGAGGFVHDYNWWDPTGICGDAPCDNAGHGTHTMGTMVGGDGPGPFTPDTGVAPGAQWIAAKGCEDLFCSEESLLSAGQWILAPTDLNGQNPDPSKRPDIVNNSWGSGPGDPFYLDTVQAWRAAGIIPVFASGNPGPDCGQGGSPGDFLESLSVGATDSSDQIAEFSGRGPSVYGKVNPDVAAPGVDVVSSVPGGGYEAFSGTSMATPHVAGTLALMLSAKPSLRGDVATAMDLVRRTAIDHVDLTCGGDADGDPNNVYGDGRIDAKAAVDLVATGGTLSGTITDDATSAPIAGATITADDGTRQFSAVTDATGTFELLLAAGSYDVMVEAFGYAPASRSGIVVATDQTTDLDVALTALPRFHLTGTIRGAEDGAPIQGASVLAVGTPVPPATTDATGHYDLTLPIGSYTIRGSAGGCTEVQVVEGVVISGPTTHDFVLARKIDAFGHGCQVVAFDWVPATSETALYGDDFVGRLHLPFPFTFYGAAYTQVFLSDNGYLDFLGPDVGNPLPVAIPSTNPPNAAIYALWRDLYLDDGSSIGTATVGSPGARTFVIEYKDIRVRGATTPIDFEVKLHEGGETVDLLYGDNPANPGDGRGATVGIENATGTDALQFSYGEGLITPDTAYRFAVVPVGTVHGTVTDANDGAPVAGALVRATPGLVSAHTADDGTYSLRTYPGSYSIAISASGYVSQTTPVTLADGADVTVDAALATGIPSVDPPTIELSVPYGAAPTTQDVTLANTGSAAFDWEAKERDRGSTPAEIPAGVAGRGSLAGTKATSRTPVSKVTPTLVSPHATGQSALVLMDALPWESDALQQVLDANGIGYDVLGSSDMASVDLGAYQFVIIANDQPQQFYDRYVANAARFDAYVSGGGFLWMEAASGGFNGGDLSGAPLPGGARVGPFMPEDVNDVAEPGHPLMAGVPNPFTGTSASHTTFEDLPSDADIIATSPSTGEPTLAQWSVGGGTVVAFGQPLEYNFAADQDGGRILQNAAPYAATYYRDVSWLSESPTTGTILPAGSTKVAVTIGAAGLAPGTYQGSVVFVTTAAKPRAVTLDVDLTVELPASWGGLSGTVTDAHSDEPLSGVSVVLHSQWNGAALDVPATTGGDGTYTLIGPSGTWPLQFALDGYVGETRNETVTAGTTRTGVDAALHAAVPHSTVDGGPFVFTLTPGRTGHGTITVGNPAGHVDLTVKVDEVDLGGPAATGAAVAAGKAALRPAPGVDPNARTSRGTAGATGTAVPPKLAADGDVLASWPTGLNVPWGVGVTGDVWLSDPDQLIDASFTTAGDPLAQFGVKDWVGAWNADMAYDAGRGLLWQVNVGGDNGIYGLDPSDGHVVQSITGSPWSNISQRGLAYDPDADVFYIGGWNEGVIYRVAGPSHPTPGETLSQCNAPDPSISGLAWNRSFGLLWEATNSESDAIWLVDPATCEGLRAIPHPDGGGFNGAGLEADAVGNLWTVGQNSQNAFLLESGLFEFSDVPWLSVTPTSATIAPDGSADVDVAVDSTGLAPGVYRAIVVVQTNDPAQKAVQVPVTLVVPAYQQGIDVGGTTTTNANGDVFATDRAYGTGPYGFVGAGNTRSTSAGISGTTEDGLYQDARIGMSSYRFDVPNGTYKVDLSFAEIQATKSGQRVFRVAIEGTPVLSDFDIFAIAGRNAAVDRSFEVTVTDGHLDIDFAAQRGDKPIVNAILVTDVPAGAPGG